MVNTSCQKSETDTSSKWNAFQVFPAEVNANCVHLYQLYLFLYLFGTHLKARVCKTFIKMFKDMGDDNKG